MPTQNNVTTPAPRRPKWRYAIIVVVLVAAGWLVMRRGGSTAGKAPTFVARKGSLDIKVLEGGSLQALESQDVKCEVRVGYQGTKILKIVEEGYFVTEDDIKNGKVLCELDSSDLQKQIAQQEIQYQSALANLTDAEQNYEIQLGQNDSDIKAAEQKARFARMDFDKYLGDTVTGDMIAQVGLDRLLASATTNDVEQTLHADNASAPKTTPPRPAQPLSASAPGVPLPQQVDVPGIAIQVMNAGAPSIAAAPGAGNLPVIMPATGNSKPPAVKMDADTEKADNDAPPAVKPPAIRLDFSKYASLDVLGDGEAKQKLRKFDDDLQVAQKEIGQSKSTMDGTRRLFEKGFVTKTDLQRDEIANDNSRLKVQTAATARDLFLKYEFPRTSEETLSKFADAVRELDKARRVAISKLAQARAKLNSAKGQYEVQSRQRKDMNEQLDKCTLRAKKSGLVVYGSGRDDMVFYGDQERIREGATVRERQAILTIPDMTHMSVNVKIHESYIKKVRKGQKARITVDAFPDHPLTGEVTKVGVLPDSQNRWMNPDLKVYVTTIDIDGTQEWAKPGMNAKVEILVSNLTDVVYIPIQAIVPEDGKQVCYIQHGSTPDRREVKIGDFTDEFIEIKEGVREGELVMIRPPESTETTQDANEKKPGDKSAETPPAGASPAAAPDAGAKLPKA